MRPEFDSVGGVDQFGDNSYPVALFANCPFEQRRNPKFLANRLRFFLSLFKTKGRAATDDFEFSDLCQSGDQFFGKPVRKIFVLWIAALIQQRQNRDRFVVGTHSRCRSWRGKESVGE